MNELYTGKTERKVVRYDIHNGIEYAIISMGHHPCAYVLIGKDSKVYSKDLEDDWGDVVHGGITWCDNELEPICDKDCEKWVLGWDYAHYGDYTTMDTPFGEWGNDTGKKYTIKEIMEDIYSIIAKIKECDAK